MKRIRLVVRGKVQGVFYRKNTLEIARNLALNGFVKNQADGSVLIEAEGREVDLRRLLDWCKEGPAQARVESVEVDEMEPVGFNGFEIRL